MAIKKINFFFLFFISIVLVLSCQEETKEPAINSTNQLIEQNASDSSQNTTIQWLDSVQQFGKVTDGEKVLISFRFKNTGTKPLVVSDVTAGCGCTIPEKPEKPIAPGEEGIIKAEFNSSGKVGQVSKNVNVTCNTATQHYTLLFEGEVLEKKQSQ